MNTTPDPLETIFTEYTDGAAADVQGRSPDPLWRRMRRRRAGRAAVAGAAALALAAPATWLLANAAGADEQERPQAAQERARDDAPLSADEYLEAFGSGSDLVGDTIDLPSFVPGNADVDEVCATDGAVLGDGTVAEPLEGGAVFIVQTREAPLSEGSDDFHRIGLFGCRYDGTSLYQVVTLDEVEDGTWAAGTQLVHSELDGESPQYVHAAVDGGLVVGFAERYDPAADDLRYWAESVTLDADGEPVREVLGELGPEHYSEVSVGVSATPTDEAGVWTVTVEVHNTGPRPLADYVLTAATDPEVEILSGEAVNLRTDPLGTWDVVAEIDEIPVGDVFAQQWTVAVDASAEQDYAELPQFIGEVVSATPYDELPPTVQALGWIGAADSYVFTE